MSFTFFIRNAYRNISDLAGLEYAANLQTLFLQSNSISDIAPLSNLTRLTNLYLSNNNISDISALSNITAIHTLLLDNNDLTNLDGLPDLSSATTLHFQNNQITNIGSLVDHSEFTSVNEPYSKYVNLEGNPLDDISINTHIQTLRERRIEVNFPFKFLKKISGDKQAAPLTRSCNRLSLRCTIIIITHSQEKRLGFELGGRAIILLMALLEGVGLLHCIR